MADEPSLSSLYRRGKYSRFDIPGEGENVPLQERRELFAVAAVAFTMKHDAAFKRHFLKAICGIDDIEKPEEYKVHVQPDDFDLVLTNDEKSEVIILEFKVRASLAKHQNYQEPDFFLSGEKDGYGKQIDEKYSSRYVRKHYVILKEFNGPADDIASGMETIEGVKCSSKTWSKLLSGDSQMSGLVLDLLDCLAEAIGIVELKGRMFMKKDLVKHAMDAVNMNGVLDSIRLDAQLRFRRCDKPKFDGQSFGVEIIEPSIGFEWKGICKDRFVWFGYEQDRISVWICGLTLTDPKCKNFRAKINAQFEEELREKSVEIIEEKSGAFLIKNSPAQRPDNDKVVWLGDQEWFRNVLTKLKDLPVEL